MEERSFTPAETQFDERDGKLPVISGYAAVFNSLSKELPLGEGRTFREIILPGAFSESLGAGDDVMARYEHSQILGRISNGTLRLNEDAKGLRYQIDPAETTAGRDAVALIRRRDIPYSSFSFSVRKGGDTWKRDGKNTIRELRSVSLIDVAPVSNPAYSTTDVAVRSYLESNIDPEFIELFSQRMKMRLRLAEHI